MTAPQKLVYIPTYARIDSPIRNSGRYGDVNPGLTGLAELPTGEPSVIGSISVKVTRRRRRKNHET